MESKLRVLLVEDSEDDTMLLLREIRRGGYDPVSERVDTAIAMKAALAGNIWDLVISDYRMPQFSAPAALEVLQESGCDIPFIIVSGKIGEDMAVAAMKAGAHDYLMKGNLSRLVPAIERELREASGRQQRRLAEEAIRHGKMEWEAVFDALSDLIILTDLNGKILRCNKRVTAYFASYYKEMVGKQITELLYGANKPEAKAFQFPHKLTAGLEDDLRFPTLKGWFNVACYPMFLEQEKPHGIVFIIKDITKRKRMEEEKRLTDRELLTLYAIAFRLNSKSGTQKIMEDLLFQLHNMLEIDFSCIHLLDDRGNLKLVASLGLTKKFEAAAKKMPPALKWVEDVLAGKPFKGKGIEGHLPATITAAAEEMGMHGWCAVPLKIGVDVTGMLLVAHRAEKSYTDREVFLLSSIANQLAVLIENHLLYDQTKEKAEELQRSRQELKENLQQVKRANIELGRLNAAKNSFIGMASHELKTPITSIQGGIQFLLHYSGMQMTTEQHDIMTSVFEGISQLKALVDDLLSISRIEADGISLQKKPLNLITLSREVYESFTLALSKRNIKVQINTNEQLVLVDDGFSRLVVRNLLENAIKFTPDGGKITVQGAITSGAELLKQGGIIKPFYPGFAKAVSPNASFYRLDIEDSGIGIPVEEQQRIFDKFYGVGDIAYHSSGKTDFMSKGSGLGLSIVKGIMDAHGGMVWVASGPERGGSTFSLVFPMG